MDAMTRNNVKVTGRGTRPMLFAHGFGCDQNMWRFVAPDFEDIIAPREVGEFVHRALGGSTPRLMRATGHCPQMSAPDETIALMREYLASRDAA